MVKIFNIFCIIGGLLLIFSLTYSQGNMLDVKKIIKNHFEVLNNNKLQLFVINVVPIAFSIRLSMEKCINEDILNNINVVLSILIAMFFSVISILCSIKTDGKKELFKRVLNETFNSSMFEIILCLILLCISFATIVFADKCTDSFVLSGVIYYFLMVIIMNILMILKRIKVLFDSQ